MFAFHSDRPKGAISVGTLNHREMSASLVDLMVENGIDRSVAELAANKCVLAMLTGGIAAGGALSAPVVIATFGVGAVPAWFVGFFAGAGLVAKKAPFCGDVREAAAYWVRSRITEPLSSF
jgi:hypothetical protein